MAGVPWHETECFKTAAGRLSKGASEFVSCIKSDFTCLGVSSPSLSEAWSITRRHLAWLVNLHVRHSGKQLVWQTVKTFRRKNYAGCFFAGKSSLVISGIIAAKYSESVEDHWGCNDQTYMNHQQTIGNSLAYFPQWVLLWLCPAILKARQGKQRIDMDSKLSPVLPCWLRWRRCEKRWRRCVGNFALCFAGEVYLSERLDYENVKKERLLIEARDQGAPSKSTNTTLTINVVNVNDRRPVLSPNSVVLHVKESITTTKHLVKVKSMLLTQSVPKVEVHLRNIF